MAIVGSSKATVGSQTGSTFTNITNGGKPPGANITRPTVARPNMGDYGPNPTRATIAAPDRGAFGTPSREGMGETAADVKKFREEYNDPTSSAGYKAAMGIASEKGASVFGEVAREGRESASKAGYSGGFDSRAKAADQSRFQALSSAAFEGVKDVRDQALGGYKTSLDSLTSMIGNYNHDMTTSNVAFGGAMNDRNIAQAQSDNQFSKLVQDKNLSYADATAHANELQAQLDSAFNNQLIDNAKYNQMSQSLAAQLAMEQARLKENSRQFDLTREDALAEAAKNRTSQGIDPTTGRRYGQAYQG